MAARRRGARSGRGWDAAPPPTGESARRGHARRRPVADDGAYVGGADGDAPDVHGADVDGRAGWSRQGGDRARRSAGEVGGRGGGQAAGRSGAAGSRPDDRDPAEVAREICLRQLAVRPRTRAELATTLRRRGVDDEVAAQVLDRYDEVGLIDDAAFARAWVTSRHHGRGLARRALANELRQRGVDTDTVGEALEGLDPDTEAATARAMIDRKLRGMGRAEPAAAFRRLVGMLARKGYPPGVAIRAVKDALAAQSQEAAEFADQLDEDAMVDAAGDPGAAGSSA